MTDDEMEAAGWPRAGAGQVEAWLRQNNLIYGALIGAGVVMVQPFLTAGALNLAAKISVAAFSVAIPLLAALVLLNLQESYRRRTSTSGVVAVAQVIAQASAITGLVAAFWHIWWIAGVAILASSVVAVGVHAAGYSRLEQELSARPEETADAITP